MNPTITKCPTCRTDCTIVWSGLELVENTGDETLATKGYAPTKVQQAAPELLEALKDIIEIGKRDLSNPKYDGYFEFAKKVIKKATP